ncbi:uncharacterized protein LOC132551454 [Ylistrum balloti]|uniref:uncharacterized protein LOC132551454 n=1 Tax=Ylistrum balloti TaxID=509963 RepID=UPI002905C2A7|nr:uncharacterized protein LOC132551454 [Ylistrum balloti]
MFGHASRCAQRTNFCEACEGSNPLGLVDQLITSTLAAPTKDEIRIALNLLRISISSKYCNLTYAHNPVHDACENGHISSIPRQRDINDFLKVLFKKITSIAVTTKYADCKLEEGRSGNYGAVRNSINQALCALLRRNRTFRNDRKLCSARYCPLPDQSDATNTDRIEFERRTLLESFNILSGVITSWEECINEEDETYTCGTSARRRSRRHNKGRKGGRRGRKGGRRRGKDRKSRKELRKRCMKKSGKPRKRCLRKLKKKYKL